MGMVRILSRRGDECATWDLSKVAVGDPEALAAVREAERMFDEARAKGATAFTVAPDQTVKRLDRFDQEAPQMVMVPRIVGG